METVKDICQHVSTGRNVVHDTHDRSATVGQKISVSVIFENHIFRPAAFFIFCLQLPPPSNRWTA